jgi:hypothetical protein
MARCSVWLADGSRWSRRLRSTRPELLEHGDPMFSVMIEAMLDARRAIFEGYERLHRVLLQVVQHDAVCRRLMTVPSITGRPPGSAGEAV